MGGKPYMVGGRAKHRLGEFIIIIFRKHSQEQVRVKEMVWVYLIRSTQLEYKYEWLR